MQQLSSKCR